MKRREVLVGIGGAATGAGALWKGEELLNRLRGDWVGGGGTAHDSGLVRAERFRPVVGGTWITAEDVDGAGTLGVGCSWDGDPVVVTNRHVIDQDSDEDPEDVVGRLVGQPTPDEPLGEVLDASKVGGAGSSDWAVVEVSASSYWSTEGLGIGSVGEPVEASEGDRVVVDGAGTGLLGGTVERAAVDANFRGKLYTDMVDYRVDEHRETTGNSGGLVGVVENGEFRPIGLHTFSFDTGEKFAIPWSDLPEGLDPTATGEEPRPPDVDARVEGVIHGRDSDGLRVRVSNIGGEATTETVSVSDPDGAEVDSVEVDLDALQTLDVTLADSETDEYRLQVGTTDVLTEIEAEGGSA